jgi:hypothetical protein
MLKLWTARLSLAASRARIGPRLLPALACLILLGTAAGSAASFTASLDRDTITLGESATLSLSFSGGNAPDAPTLPAVPNLRIQYAGKSSQVTIDNGQFSSTVTHSYSVTPQQAGEFTIPSLTAQMGNQKLVAPALKLNVLKPGAPPPEAIASGAQLAFLKLMLPKKEIYLNEIVSAELQLYLNTRVQGIDRFQLTAFPSDGFNVGKLVQGKNRQAQIGNVVYNVIPLSLTLKPVRNGPLTLGPVTVSVVLEIPGGRRRDPFFEQFGMRDPFDMFGGKAQKQATLATEPETIQCLPLPSVNVPQLFNGAVGTFTMNATAGPTNVAAGDPITIKVEISGKGALDTLNLPEQTNWRDFKTYPPSTRIDTTDPLGIQGTKSFEQVVVPQTADVTALPPISFCYFDPDRKSYQTLTRPAIPLTVRPTASAAAPTVVASTPGPDAAPPKQDIVHIKPRLGTVAHIDAPLIRQPWFVLLQTVPFAGLILALVWRKRVELLANNPRLRRRRRVAQIVREGTGRLKSLAAENRADDFFATLFHLLQEQLGERLDLPATAITEAVIEEHLRPRGVPERFLAPLQELFQTCNLARYAPLKTSQELAAVVARFEAVSGELRELSL